MGDVCSNVVSAPLLCQFLALVEKVPKSRAVAHLPLDPGTGQDTLSGRFDGPEGTSITDTVLAVATFLECMTLKVPP